MPRRRVFWFCMRVDLSAGTSSALRPASVPFKVVFICVAQSVFASNIRRRMELSCPTVTSSILSDSKPFRDSSEGTVPGVVTAKASLDKLVRPLSVRKVSCACVRPCSRALAVKLPPIPGSSPFFYNEARKGNEKDMWTENESYETSEIVNAT